MEQKNVKGVTYYYMWFWRQGRQERSPEFATMQEFTNACGKWCDAHPGQFRICTRTAYVPA